MSKPKAPSPPSPKETSAASTATNVGTAIANANLGNVNQVTPDGNLTYDQTSTYTWKDPYTGKSYDIPRYTATQTLSDIGQATKDQTDQASLNMGKVANNQSAFLNDYLGTPVDLSSGNIANYTNTHFGDDFNRQWGTNQTDLENQLANRGVQQGSAAYSKALADFNTNKANAYDNMHGNQYGLAQQSILTQRNQPLNELSALMSGSQVQQPSYVNTNMPTIPTTDTAGLINQNYQQKLQNYQQQQAQSQGLLGGLFGLGASAIKYSDRRLKTNIERIGVYANGLPLYAFEYIWGGGRTIGLMSDDVRAFRPEAVIDINGMDAVDYGKALA